MMLLTKADAKKLPSLVSQENMELTDRKLLVKFFTPFSNFTWYATEYDPADRIFFGYVVGQDAEWGYFSLDQLEAIRGPLGLGVERDLYWNPVTFGEAQRRGILR